MSAYLSHWCVSRAVLVRGVGRFPVCKHRPCHAPPRRCRLLTHQVHGCFSKTPHPGGITRADGERTQGGNSTMGKQHTFNTPIPQRWAFLRCFVACTLTFASVLFFNGTAGPQTAAAFDIAQIKMARDMSCMAGIAAFIILMFVARYRPQAIRPVTLSVSAAILGLVGHALSIASGALDVQALLVLGSCATSVATTWTTVLLLLACSSLSLQRVCVCLAAAPPWPCPWRMSSVR